jgi:large subunit ribosomal protein L4
MAELTYFDKTGRKAGVVEVDEKIFGERVRSKLLHHMVIAYEANRRSGTRKGLRKGEVEGSARKPWPQKHTGRARAGMIRSPIWRKGGQPHSIRPQDWRQRVPKGMKESAVNSALLGKLKDRQLHVIESFSIDPLSPQKPKLASQAARILEATGLSRSLLIAIEGYREVSWRAVRNLPKVSMREVNRLNAYDLVRHKEILFTRAALERIVKERNGEIRGPKG